MDNTDMFGGHQWDFGAHGSLWTRINTDTVVYTWAALGIIAAIAGLSRWCLLWYPHSMVSFVIKWCMRTLVGAIEHSCHKVPQRYISFFCTLFMLLLVSNCLLIIPTFEEPTKDLNTALALSIMTFLFVQMEALYHHGFIAYANDLFKTPIPIRGIYPVITVGTALLTMLRIVGNIIMGTLMFPLEVLGKISGVISLSFRLFGNILAGSVIASLWLKARSGSWLVQALGLLTGFNLLITLFFGIFEGCVQAFVFVMLAISLLSRSLQPHH